MEKYCYKFSTLFIGYEPETSQIKICRCCMKKSDPIKCYTIEEWKKLDIYKELSTLINTWPKNFNREVYPPHCKVSECYYEDELTFKGVEVSLLPHCNLSCEFCGARPQQQIVKQNNEFNKLKEVYFYTLNQLKGHGLDYLRLSEFGEPLLFKKENLEFFKKSSEEDFHGITITTNGTLIDDDYIEAFKNSKIDFSLSVSLNAWDRESYKRIMGKDSFDTVIENLYKLKKEYNTCQVTFVVKNDEDKKKMEVLAEKLRADGFSTVYIPFL